MQFPSIRAVESSETPVDWLSTVLEHWKRLLVHRRRNAKLNSLLPGEFFVEPLEARIVPYATTGDAWPQPELVTISFEPDGTNLAGVSSNLVSAFNAKFGTSAAWKNQMLKAAQAWAQQTNLNFTVTADSGANMGAGDFQQGDPSFGDIRIGGYNFGSAALAQAMLPPPANNYSIAGDIQFNTGKTWNIGSTYDVFTVAIHEFGHALGLNHATSSAAVMYSAYNGVDVGLNTDDINGIRAIYRGARAADSYDAAASNGTFATATNITSVIDGASNTALVEDRDITTTSDIDFYKFTAPSGGTGTLVVQVQSSDLSLLAPKAWVYSNGQSQLAVSTGSGYLGSTLMLTVNGIVAGQNYYLKVDGADATAFGTGKYAVTLNFSTNPNPSVPLPNTQTPNGDPLQAGGGLANSPDNDDPVDPRQHDSSGADHHRHDPVGAGFDHSDDDVSSESDRKAVRDELDVALFSNWESLLELTSDGLGEG